MFCFIHSSYVFWLGEINPFTFNIISDREGLTIVILFIVVCSVVVLCLFSSLVFFLCDLIIFSSGSMLGFLSFFFCVSTSYFNTQGFSILLKKADILFYSISNIITINLVLFVLYILVCPILSNPGVCKIFCKNADKHFIMWAIWSLLQLLNRKQP